MSEYIPTPPAAGWYPDPSGQPGVRYHDGTMWTSHFTPNPPAAQQPSVVVNNQMAAPAPAVAVAVSTNRGTSHGLHLLLTLLTCGAWLPIWLIVAIVGSISRRSSVAVAGGQGGVAVSNGNASKIGLIVGAVFVGLFLMGTVAENPWLLAILAPVAMAGGGAFYVYKQKQLRSDEDQKLAMRAEYENQLYAEGDPRGTHGRFPGPENLR